MGGKDSEGGALAMGGMTIRELSRRCGLSVSTVSKALNNYPDISKETRARVLKTAQALNYYPNSLARGLKTNRTYNLGVILDDETRDSLLHPFFVIILNGFRREAEMLGYDITLINRNIGSQRLSYLDHCRYRNVDGICLMCVDFRSPQIYDLAQGALPLITIDHLFRNRECVFSDNRDGIRSLLRYAMDMGHRRIAFVHGTPSDVTDVRTAAFREALRERGLPVPEAFMAPGYYNSTRHAVEAVNALLALPEPPTCILMPDDYSALGGIGAITGKGMPIPEDVSVVGYDGNPTIQKILPRLTTYRQGGDEIGRRAAQRLIARIEHPDAPMDAPDVVSGKLLQGETVQRLDA
jgi:DNA-binding LacI/PurR family transcriptional regulator